MSEKRLRKVLENTENRLEILADARTYRKYKCTLLDVLDVVQEFLNDNEKLSLLKSKHVRSEEPNIKSSILKSIIDDNLKIQALYDSEIISGMSQVDLAEIIAGLKDEKTKSEMIKRFNLDERKKNYVLKTFSDKSKTNILINGLNISGKYSFIDLFSSMSVSSLVDLIKNNPDLLKKYNIRPYEITQVLSIQDQTEFVSKLGKIGLSKKDEKLILATLHDETKREIDKSSFSREYLTALRMRIEKNSGIIQNPSYGKIIVNLSRNLEDYKDLDELLYVETAYISNRHREKLLELCEICPDIKVSDEMELGYSTGKEYRNAEMWIDSVLQKLNPRWMDIQKVAYIDNAIGKKVSYSPDFDTEVFDDEGSRTIWKIIDSGYGVCNGIAQIEKYMLSRVGIDTEMVSSKTHAFLKWENAKIPMSNGRVVIRNTILDPTWNLAANRYGARPNNFCRSYEEIRKHDIKEDGTDSESHKNAFKLANCTLDLDDTSLRNIYSSIGIADKEGKFPISKLISRIKELKNSNMTQKENLERRFQLLKEYYPEFASCMNSTSAILTDVVLKDISIEFNRCIVKRVYEKSDEKKEPVLYVYIDSKEMRRKFYIVSKNEKKFIQMEQNEFEERFECYEKDLEKENGRKPWKDRIKGKNEENLDKNSGEMIIAEGDER